MDKPSGICIHHKDSSFGEAFFIRTTDINEAILVFTEKNGTGFDFSEMFIHYFYDRPFFYDFKSDLFNY